MFSYMKRGSGFYKEVAVLAAPIVMQNLITSTLSMADTFMVGLMGEAPMAAVTLANIPIRAVNMFIFGAQSGSSILISQYWGKQDRRSISRVMGAAMWTVLAVTALFALIMDLWPLEFLSLFGNEQSVIATAAQYGDLAALSCCFNGLTMMYIAAYRSMEKPQLGMYVLIASMSLNTFLNWVFIFGHLGSPVMGVRGAALATLIARIFEVCAITVHMLVTRFFRVDFAALFRPGREMLRRFFLYGGPVVLNETMWGLGTSVMPTIMGHMANSTEILAAYTITSNVEQVVNVVGFGIAATAAVIIGREVGAGRTEQVFPTGKALATLGFLTGTALGVPLFIFARWVAPAVVFPLFHLSAGASAIAMMMITVQSFQMPLRDFNCVNIVGVLRGGGDVRAATLIDVCPLWVCAIPYAAVCGLILRLDITWVYLAYVIENLVKVGIGLWRLRSGKWIRDLTVSLH